MKKKSINSKKLTSSIDKMYKDDFYLQKTIAQTKKARSNNKTLEARKKKLKELVIEINNEYEINRTPSKRILHNSNSNFHNEYQQFNKTINKKDTKEIFKDLVKRYKSKGYRIPNFSLNDHNLFKINPLLETNTEMISNGLLEQQISKKNNDSDKIMKYLKKLEIILSSKLSKDSRKQRRSLMKKFSIPKLKVILNDEDSIKTLKEKIQILTNLINSNELIHLDEKRKKKYGSFSRKNSLSSINYNSNKKIFPLNKNKFKGFDRFHDRRKSNRSTHSNASLMNKNKTPRPIYNGFSFTSYAGAAGVILPQRSKEISIEVKINKNYDKKCSNTSIITSSYDNKKKFNKNVKSQKIFVEKRNFLNKNQLKLGIDPIRKGKNNRYPIFIKTQSRNDSYSNNYNDISEEIILDLKTPRSPLDDYKANSSFKDIDKKKNDSNNYPYSSRNEFVNFYFNRLKRKNKENSEDYIKNYLNKVKGLDKEQTKIFVNNIYKKNIKNNIKELEKQITENDLYYKTERLYLNYHQIKRIKPLLNTLGERNKMIFRLEKNLTNAVSNK